MEEDPPKKRVLLELFSGTGSVGRAFRSRGWDVISVDNDPKAHADIRKDILEFETKELLDRKVDLVWASPPCTLYSIVRRVGETSTEATQGADRLVEKTLEVVAELGCPVFIENPWTGDLKNRKLLDHLRLRKVDYCKYGMDYRKRTAIWTSTAWEPKETLCARDCGKMDGRKHIARAQQGGPGPSFSQKDLYKIPDKLCSEIASWATTTT